MTSLDEPRSEKSDESDSDSDLEVLKVNVTRTIVNSEAAKVKRESINLQVGSDCTIETLTLAIKNKLGLREDAADFFLFYWEVCLNDHYTKETKLVDLGIDPPSFDFSMEYPTATLRDVVKPQNPVMISSDIPRRIIHPKRGMRAGLFFTPIHVKDFETELTLTSKGEDMILYLDDPDVAKVDGKYFTLGYLLPRNTRKVAIESFPHSEAPNGSRFKLEIEIVEGFKETIKFEDGKQRIFSEGSKVDNVLAAASLGATVGAGVGAVGSPVGAAIGGAVGGVFGAVGGALLPK